MVFSSLIFMYVFLPIVLIIYFVAPMKIKNFILLITGLFFYAWGEPIYVIIMILATIADYTVGRLIDKYDDNEILRKRILICSIIMNVGLLAVFKYSSFIIVSINNVFGTNIYDPQLPLPIGISFYTFQSMSYTIDVYRRHVKVQKSPINYMAFVTLFPQIVAGPIVRYEDVENELTSRKINVYRVGDGAQLFIKGLAKKILLANNIGTLWTSIKLLDFTQISAGTAWIGILAYTFQIYFDFSGYSDMAIGLGKMLGFNFPQNFDHPYISRSISEFWRRWHMTLGGWFRSYVYIPLGGNRCGTAKTLRNLLVVWGLTGLWHGASWSFILWGLYFGLLIIIERLGFGKILAKAPPILSTLYTFLLVMFGWILFDTTSLADAGNYIKAMFGGNGVFVNSLSQYQLSSYIVIFIACIFASTEFFPRIVKYLRETPKTQKWFYISAPIIQAAVMLLCTAYLVDATYNPFLYFRF